MAQRLSWGLPLSPCALGLCLQSPFPQEGYSSVFPLLTLEKNPWR